MVIDWTAITYVTALCIVVAIISFLIGYVKGEYNGWCNARRDLNCFLELGNSRWREDRLRGVKKREKKSS